MAGTHLNALGRDSSIEAWQATGLSLWIAQRMAHIELAAQGLTALTRLLANNGVELEAALLGDADAARGAPSGNQTGGLHAAAEALAIFSQRELETVRDVLTTEREATRGARRASKARALDNERASQ
jgi:hypothetical protein